MSYFGNIIGAIFGKPVNYLRINAYSDDEVYNKAKARAEETGEIQPIRFVDKNGVPTGQEILIYPDKVLKEREEEMFFDNHF